MAQSGGGIQHKGRGLRGLISSRQNSSRGAERARHLVGMALQEAELSQGPGGAGAERTGLSGESGARTEFWGRGSG